MQYPGPLRLLAGTLALGGLVALASGAGGQGPPGDGLVLRDRIVAVVDQDPILLSDIEQAIAVGLNPPEEGEGPEAHRRRVLDQLIDQRLRLHEMDRFGSVDVPVAAIEAQIEAIRARHPGEGELETKLRELGMTEDDLRELVARRLAVYEYVDQRLGPRVFVTLDDIRAYYEEEVVPALEAMGAAVPPLPELRDELRELLDQLRRNEELDRWTAELRQEADIEILADDYPEELPPVVDRVESPSSSEP